MKRLLFLAIALLIAGLTAATAGLPTNARLTISLTPSGVIDTTFRTGASSPAVAWPTVANIAKLTTDTGSVNLCTGLTGTGAATATLSVTSGYSLPTGFSLGSTRNCVLSWSAPSTASVLMKIDATYSSTAYPSPQFSIQVTAPPGSDTLAPTIPVLLTATPGVNVLSLSWPPSADRGTGVKEYDVMVSGSAVATVSATAENPPVYAFQNVGALSPTPTATPSGNDVSMVAAGTIDGTTSAYGLYETPVAGNYWTASLKVNGITHTADYAKGGICGRNTASTGSSAEICLVAVEAGGNKFVQLSTRGADGASTQFITTIEIASWPDVLQLVRTSATTFDARYQLSGGPIVTIAPSSFSFVAASTMYVGSMCSATTGTGGATATCDLKNLAISTLPNVTYSYSTTTAKTVSIRARDLTGTPNVSASGSAVTATPLSASASIKWYPGNYIFPGNFNCDANTEADDFATFDEIAGIANIKGIYVHWQWSCFEGNTANDYSSGFARIDRYIAKANAVGKKLMVGLWPMRWGNCTPGSVTSTSYFPSYMQSALGGSDYVSFCAQDGRIWTLDWWKSGAVDRVIALSAAYANRYDSNSTFVMFELQEESAGISGDASRGFTWPGSEAQWDRAYAAASLQWTHTLLRMPQNWGETAWLRGTFEAGRPGIIFGGADSMPETTHVIAGYCIFRGLDPPGGSACGSAHAGWTDLRGSFPWLAEQQGDQLIYGSNCVDTLYAFGRNTMHSSYAILTRQSYDGITCRYWNATKSFLQNNTGGAATPYTTACPTGWSCDTSFLMPAYMDRKYLVAPAANDERFAAAA